MGLSGGQSDIYSLDGTSEVGPATPDFQYLPMCSIKINARTAMVMDRLIGGTMETIPRFFSVADFTWTEGPPLLETLSSAACGLVHDAADPSLTYIVVAGDAADNLNSTEILLVGSDQWVVGPGVPTNMTNGAQIASAPDGKSLVLSGGEWYGYISRSFYRFQCSNGIDNCQWTNLGIEMRQRRTSHAAVFLPELHYPCERTSTTTTTTTTASPTTIAPTSNLMMFGGSPSRTIDGQRVELIHLANSGTQSFKCTHHAIPRFPIKRPYRHAMTMLEDGKTLVACGGYDGTNRKISNFCHLLINNAWVQARNMSRTIGNPYMFAVNDTAWFVGNSGHSEIHSTDGRIIDYPTVLDKMLDPEPCATKINSTSAIVIGGRYFLHPRETYYYRVDKDSWSDGPLLNVLRYGGVACGTLQDGGADVSSANAYVVVAGGYFASPPYYNNLEPMDSTEILPVGTDQWIEGPNMPAARQDGRLAPSPDGRSLVFSGGYNKIEDSDEPYHKTLYLFQCLNGINSCHWRVLPIEIDEGRSRHVAMFVPESDFPCSTSATPTSASTTTSTTTTQNSVTVSGKFIFGFCLPKSKDCW